MSASRSAPPAAFICEPFCGNAGGMALPDGDLTSLLLAFARTEGEADVQC
jgi:Na+/H+ antiporter NhaD/arsenite permease-like protein